MTRRPRASIAIASLAVLASATVASAQPEPLPPPLPTVLTRVAANGDILITPTGLMEDGVEENYANKIAVCFSDDTPTDYAARITQQVDAMNAAMLGDRYQSTTRWSGAQGNPITLTWSFAPDGLSIPDGIGEGVANNTLFATMDAQFASQGGRAGWIARFQAMFDRWSAITGITYVRVTVGGNDWDDGASWGSSGAAGLRGDIRICAKPLDGGGGVLAYNSFPGTGTGGNMHLDNGEAWGNSSNANRFMRNIIAHEHGHGIGLLHVCPAIGTKLMEPFISTAYDGPQHDDFRAGQRHYGDPQEGDNTTALATPLGALTLGTTVSPCGIPAPISGSNPANTSNCSIDADGEQDFFSFSVSAAASVDITVTPLGTSYEDCAQDSQCSAASCTTTTDSTVAADLAVQLISTNGTTVIATASSSAAGLAESIADAALPAAGTYFIRVFESGTQTQTQLYSLSILATPPGCTGPNVAGQPGNQSVCLDLPATFSVTATGSPAPTYQWRRGTTNLADDGRITGATTATLNINPVVAADAASNYNCVVTSPCGSITSNNASLTVNSAPTITGQPANRTLCPNNSTSFTVTASSTAPLTFQWRRGTTNLVNGGNVSGATTATLTINPVTAADAATNYNCVVSNGCGSPRISNNASLTVNTPASVNTPQNQTGCIGGTATFSVTAGGSPAPTFQWRRGLTNLTNGGNISGATTATLTINPIAAGDAVNNYNCVVTNACGSATSGNATLTLNTPSITGQPSSRNVCAGEPVSLTVTAAPAGVTYRWRRGTTNLNNAGNISGATSPTLTINPVTAADAASNYNCVVTNACGSATSSSVAINVDPAPTFSQQPSNVNTSTGCTIQLSAAASGGDTLAYRWQRGADQLVDGGRISGATTATLQIAQATTADSGNYVVFVSNSCGETPSQPAVVHVCPGDLDGNATVDLGDLARLLISFGTSSGLGCTDGDLDGDGDVDLADLSTLLVGFGSPCQ